MLRVLIDGLVKRYRHIAAVDGPTLDLSPGELTCLVGPPGAGKTTLGRLIAGLEDPPITARFTSTNGLSGRCRRTSGEWVWSSRISPSGRA